MSTNEVLTLLAAGIGAGVMNSVAGGGTLLTFPALLFLGQDAITANATSTVALVPGSLASAAGYRRELAAHRRWLRVLLVPSLLGGALGSWLLLATPERAFAALAPFLVLFATVLFLAQGAWARRRTAIQREAPVSGDASIAPLAWRSALACQFLIAIYGGYFGAGIGILMLAVLGFLGLSDIHGMNGLKNVFAFAINARGGGDFHRPRLGRLAERSGDHGRRDPRRLRRSVAGTPRRPRRGAQGRGGDRPAGHGRALRAQSARLAKRDGSGYGSSGAGASLRTTASRSSIRRRSSAFSSSSFRCSP